LKPTPTDQRPADFTKKFTDDLPSSRRAEVEGFVEHLALKGASVATIGCHLVAIKSLGEGEKPYRELTKEELVQWMRELDSKYRSEHTRYDYRKRVKRFLRWLHCGEDEERSPPEPVRCVKLRKPKPAFSGEVLSLQEVKAMVEACESQRDRAMVHVLLESGCRPGELTSLRIQNVELDKYGAVLHVRGKTGNRRVRIVHAVPELQLWLNMHPSKDDPGAPLWPRSREPSEPIGVPNLGQLLRKYAKKSGLGKRVYPYLFRHTRATHLAADLPEAVMREHFGWTKDSEIPSIYVHLSGRDVDPAILRHSGVEVEESIEAKRVLAPRACQRCGFSNPASARFCNRCSAALDILAAVELEGSRRTADDITAKVMREFVRRAPELLESILEETGIAEELARFREKVGVSKAA